eukprot:gene14046-29899_t
MDRMSQLLLLHDERRKIPLPVLRQEVKDALDKQWDRLRIGQTINEVVPFLPMEQFHIYEVLKMKSRALSRTNANLHWSELKIENSVLMWLSGPTFIKYKSFSIKIPSNNKNDNNNNNKKQPDINDLDNSNQDDDGVRTKNFAVHGARNIDKAGPFQDLRRIISTKAVPYQKDKILYIRGENLPVNILEESSPHETFMERMKSFYQSWTEWISSTSTSTSGANKEVK